MGTRNAGEADLIEIRGERWHHGTMRANRRNHHSASPYEKKIGFSRAVRLGNRILVAGTAPIGSDSRTHPGGAYEQAKRCFEIIGEAIEALGGSLKDVVRTRMFLVDASDQDEVGRAHGEAFRGIDPAATMVVVAGLVDPDWRVEIEAEAEISQEVGPNG